MSYSNFIMLKSSPTQTIPIALDPVMDIDSIRIYSLLRHLSVEERLINIGTIEEHLDERLSHININKSLIRLELYRYISVNCDKYKRNIQIYKSINDAINIMHSNPSYNIFIKNDAQFEYKDKIYAHQTQNIINDYLSASINCTTGSVSVSGQSGTIGSVSVGGQSGTIGSVSVSGQSETIGSVSVGGQSGTIGSVSEGGQSGTIGSVSEGGQSGTIGSVSEGGQSGTIGSVSEGGKLDTTGIRNSDGNPAITDCKNSDDKLETTGFKNSEAKLETTGFRNSDGNPAITDCKNSDSNPVTTGYKNKSVNSVSTANKNNIGGDGAKISSLVAANTQIGAVDSLHNENLSVDSSYFSGILSSILRKGEKNKAEFNQNSDKNANNSLNINKLSETDENISEMAIDSNSASIDHIYTTTVKDPANVSKSVSNNINNTYLPTDPTTVVSSTEGRSEKSEQLNNQSPSNHLRSANNKNYSYDDLDWLSINLSTSNFIFDNFSTRKIAFDDAQTIITVIDDQHRSGLVIHSLSAFLNKLFAAAKKGTLYNPRNLLSDQSASKNRSQEKAQLLHHHVTYSNFIENNQLEAAATYLRERNLQWDGVKIISKENLG